MTGGPKWTGRLGTLGPMFGDLDEALGDRMPTTWPDIDALNGALAAGLMNRAGRRLRFVAATAHRAGALEYERRIHDDGEIPTRTGSWHDLLNALCWFLFPRSKGALNEGHCRDSSEGPRSRRRDALTLVDESGLVIATTNSCLADLNREHRWRELFLERRAAWGREIFAIPVGHGLLEQCLAPHRGLTAKAIHITVPESFGALPAHRRLALVDEWLAPRIDTLTTPRELPPLPVLGIPGWEPRNADPAYYDDTGYFRPRRG